jgi:hypothetical protein
MMFLRVYLRYEKQKKQGKAEKQKGREAEKQKSR